MSATRTPVEAGVDAKRKLMHQLIDSILDRRIGKANARPYTVGFIEHAVEEAVELIESYVKEDEREQHFETFDVAGCAFFMHCVRPDYLRYWATKYAKRRDETQAAVILAKAQKFVRDLGLGFASAYGWDASVAESSLPSEGGTNEG